jgi:hypothetical protein
LDSAEPWPDQVREALSTIAEWADSDPAGAWVLLIAFHSTSNVGVRRQSLLVELASLMYLRRSRTRDSSRPGPLLEFALVSGIAQQFARRVQARLPLQETVWLDEVGDLLLMT